MTAIVEPKAQIKFECPKCEQPIEGPRAIGGTEVSCPTCGETFIAPNAPGVGIAQVPPPLPKLQEQTNPVIYGLSLMGMAAAVFITCHFVGLMLMHSSKFGAVGMILEIGGGVFLAYAVLKVLWMIVRSVGFGIVLMVAGGIILLASWLGFGSLPGIVAGGFIAMIGTVLTVNDQQRKKS